MQLYIRVLFSIITAIMLNGCSANRPETAEYFEKVVGVNICKSAKIKNSTYSEYDFASDPTYQVIIDANSECIENLLKELYYKYEQCQNFTNECSFADENMTWYYLKKMDDGKIIFRKSYSQKQINNDNSCKISTENGC